MLKRRTLVHAREATCDCRCSAVNHSTFSPVTGLSMTNKLTKYVEQSRSWEANRDSTSQEISRLLWNSEVHYRVHYGSPLVPILSQMNPVHTYLHYAPKIHFNIILSTPKFSEWSLPFRFSDQNVLCISYLSHLCYMPRPSYPSSIDHPNNLESILDGTYFRTENSRYIPN